MKVVNYSYWELKAYFDIHDLVIIGGGIVGLSAAISFRKKNKKAKVLVLERGCFPDGASTKNAGFACFGSAGELLDDLKKMPEQDVWETVEMRWQGLQLLRKRLGDRQLAYEPLGGYELFNDLEEFKACREQINRLNLQLKHVIKSDNCFAVDNAQAKKFQGIRGVLVNRYEGQLDTALMMRCLNDMARQAGVQVLNNIEVTAMNDSGNLVELESPHGVFKTRKVLVATNGFAAALTGMKDVKPARAQVLITEPLPGLRLKGAFHYQQGYYYFRNIDNRVLLGGGRNLDFEGETTTENGLNPRIQQKLDEMLRDMVLPGIRCKIAHRWSGIMGVGSEKKPIIRVLGKNVVAAVRMGGMGVAIGSLVGEKATSLLSE